jgi:hypothetical protein
MEQRINAFEKGHSAMKALYGLRLCIIQGECLPPGQAWATNGFGGS